MLKKFLSVLMCLVLVCGMGIVANAEGVSSADEYTQVVSESEENQVQPRYSYTNIISATLANSDGKALCIANVDGYEGTTTKIVVTMTLQKKNLLWWSTVQKWSKTTYTYYNTMSYTKTVESGTYRVNVEATVYSGSNSEEVSCISKTYDF